MFILQLVILTTVAPLSADYLVGTLDGLFFKICQGKASRALVVPLP